MNVPGESLLGFVKLFREHEHDVRALEQLDFGWIGVGSPGATRVARVLIVDVIDDEGFVKPADHFPEHRMPEKQDGLVETLAAHQLANLLVPSSLRPLVESRPSMIREEELAGHVVDEIRPS